jgi:serine/threonine protein kinase
MQDAEAYDGAANDVWSLGILLLKLLGRDHPYAWKVEFDPDVDWRQEMVKGREPTWDFDAEELDRGGVGYLIHRMLDRNPYTRYSVGLQRDGTDKDCSSPSTPGTAHSRA